MSIRTMFRSRLATCFVAVGIVGLLWGCDDSQVAKPTDKGSSPWSKDHWTSVKPAQVDTGRIDPRYGRKARRVSLTHLKSMIPKLFNGLDWTDSRNNSLFNKYSATLGQADYIYQNQSHRTPTPLFMKFMDDMAGNLCNKAIKKDRENLKAGKKPEELMILRHERSPDQNLRYLRLKFHTIYVPDDSTDGIKALRDLYDKALAASQSADKAWELVCVAMVSSPEFFAY